jgi:hypothetical protein
MDTVAVGTTIDLDCASLDSTFLEFRPSGSQAIIEFNKVTSMCHFLADKPGDFVVDFSGDDAIRWNVINFAARGLDAVGEVIFEDNFRQVQDRRDSMDSDKLYKYWSVGTVGTSECNITTGGNALRVRLGAGSGETCVMNGGSSERDGNQMWIHPFSSWHRLQLNGIQLSPGSATDLVLTPPAASSPAPRHFSPRISEKVVEVSAGQPNIKLSVSTTSITLGWSTSLEAEVLVEGAHRCGEAFANSTGTWHSALACYVSRYEYLFCGKPNLATFHDSLYARPGACDTGAENEH